MIKTVTFNASTNEEVTREFTEEEYKIELAKIVVSSEVSPEDKAKAMDMGYLLDLDFRLSMIELGL